MPDRDKANAGATLAKWRHEANTWQLLIYDRSGNQTELHFCRASETADMYCGRATLIESKSRARDGGDEAVAAGMKCHHAPPLCHCIL